MLDGLGVASKVKPRKWRWIWLLPVFWVGLATLAWREHVAPSIPSLAPLVSKVRAADPPNVAPTRAGSGSAAASVARTESNMAPATAAVIGATAPVAPIGAAATTAPAVAPDAKPATPASASAPGAPTSASAPATAPVPAAVPAPAVAPAAASEPPLEVLDLVSAPAARPTAPRQRPLPAVKRVARAESRRAPTTRSVRQSDPDVDLIASLMASLPTPPPADGAAPRKRAVSTASRPARLTLDQRVQRCKAQYADKKGSRACRRRVCVSHWGRHAACPIRLMGRAATTT